MLVGLRTPDWRDQIEKEMSLVRSNTGMLFNTFTNSLLGEDFSIPTMSFDGQYSVSLRVQFEYLTLRPISRQRFRFGLNLALAFLQLCVSTVCHSFCWHALFKLAVAL